MSPHAPVMLDEVIEALQPLAGALIVDGTFGAGGYTGAFLAAGATVVALDRDPTVQPHVARLAADLLAGRTPEVDPKPFDPARFR